MTSGTAADDTSIPWADSESESRVISKEELAKYDGSDSSTPIFIAVDGLVFDVTPGADFYGKGKAYNVFAGRDATRGLAKTSLSAEDVQSSDISDLSAEEHEALAGWLHKYKAKYKVVGRLESDRCKDV